MTTLTYSIMITIIVDNKEIQVEEGANLLEVCLDNGIYVPNLCHIQDMQQPPASCRMCLVSLKGETEPVTACTIRVVDGLEVVTDTPEVRRLQRSALRLMLSVHDIDCKNCPVNKRCELQRMARFLKTGLKAAPHETLLKENTVDRTHPCLDHYPNRCVLCGKCIHICTEKNRRSVFTFAGRGFDTVVSAFGADSADTDCMACLACVEICPVGALVAR